MTTPTNSNAPKTRKQRTFVQDDVFLTTYLEFCSQSKSMEELAQHFSLATGSAIQKLKNIKLKMGDRANSLPKMRSKANLKTKMDGDFLTKIAEQKLQELAKQQQSS